ncbi:hypothetical protein Cfor_12804 [Coptotermes formosanus]|uniref:Uncharacterized protein n=1 Tax=Coptotermes formosanus TaxID=36987 RepID=A0A6L2PND8_COPFO|nr:hypothetical protein Cfor_12804 [Coptotermes formosanus]
MSSPNQSCVDLLEKLPKWSTQEVEENLAHALPVLLISFAYLSATFWKILECSDQKALSFQAVQALLNKFLPCIPVKDVEDKLFQYVLPSAKQLFNEALEGIRIRLQGVQNLQQDDVESLNGLLQICIELLTCIDNTLRYILGIGKVEAALVPTLPKVTVSVLFEAFKHCKESEKVYGILFQAVGAVATALFQKSSELQLHFLKVVSENLQFKCMHKDGLLQLTEILDAMGQIGQVVVGLDMKTMAEQWKGYACLAFQYVEHLKPRLDVAGPLQFLATHISHTLKRAVEMDPLDVKLITRTVKVGNFMLKIIIKFCDKYSGYLGACHQELLEMLLIVYRYSGPYLRMKNVRTDIIQYVDTYLTIGGEPLLQQLIGEVEFTEKMFAYGTKLVDPESQRFSFLLLSVSILKKLLHCSPDVRKQWLCHDSEHNILSVLFRGLDHCHAEMNWNVQIPGVRHRDKPERMTDLYETIVTHVGGFILSASVQEFSLVEQILLESVMQPTVWRAILAMDTWCIVARTGSSELCFQHLCHLLKVMKHLAHHHGRPEKTYLMVLTGRLFSLLPDKHKLQIAEMFPAYTEPLVWQALSVKVLPEKLRVSVTESLVRSAILHAENFLTLPASVELYYHMVDALAAASQCIQMPTLSHRHTSVIASHIVTMWQRISLKAVTAEETSVKGSQWMNHFLSVLCSISAPLTLHMDNSQLIKVLERLKDVISFGSSVIKLKVLTVLNRLANKIIESTPDQMKVFQHIAGLFSALLQDKNYIVQQMTLEVFTYFAHVNSHESILALSVKNNENLQQKTKTYLQRLPAKASYKTSLSHESYIKCQSLVKFSHSCKNSVNAHECIANSKQMSSEMESVGHTAKRLKLTVAEDTYSVIRTIERLKNDIDMLAKYCESSGLSADARKDVQQISLRLQMLCKN